MLGLAAKGLSIDLKAVDSSQAFGSCFHFLFLSICSSLPCLSFVLQWYFMIAVKDVSLMVHGSIVSFEMDSNSRFRLFWTCILAFHQLARNLHFINRWRPMWPNCPGL